MSLFSKKIDTKRDHHAEMKTAISAAINVALQAGVPEGLIERELQDHATHFRRIEEARAEARQYNPIPVMYDSLTLKPINTHEQIARAEEERNARELREQQRQYRLQNEGRIV